MRVCVTKLLLTFVFMISYVQKVDAVDFDLATYEGKVVYLDFWASWCIPCKNSFPFMNELNRKYKDQGLSVVSINVDENWSDAVDFLEKIPAEFQVIHDTNGMLLEEYEIIAMPTSFFYDRDGKLVGKHLGFKDEHIEGIVSIIEELLSAP